MKNSSFFKVYDGPSVESDLFGKWCGNVLPLPVVSTTNILTILFISDHTFNEGEFVITYTSGPYVHIYYSKEMYLQIYDNI